MNLLALVLSFALAQSATYETKLIQAVNEESLAQVKKLATDKKLLQQKDKAGHDPLYHAVSLNNPEIVSTLLKAGASTKEKYNESKESILFEATRLGNSDLVETLLKANPNLLKEKNANLESVLFEAVKADQSSLVKKYAEKGLSLLEKNKAGKTAKDFVNATNIDMLKVLKGL